MSRPTVDHRHWPAAPPFNATIIEAGAQSYPAPYHQSHHKSPWPRANIHADRWSRKHLTTLMGPE